MHWSISKLILGGGAATMLAVGAAVSGAPAVFAASTPATAAADQTAAGKHKHQDNHQDRRQIREAVVASEADVLGITPDQLRDALKAGKSVADLARDRGITKDQFADRLAAALRPRLDKLVDSGAITRAQADKVLDRIAKGHIPFWDRHDHKRK